MSLKILMFGWEFPPFNSGGLGVACLGLSRELVKNNANIVFVLPKAMDISANHMKIVFADSGKIKFENIDSLLYPYITAQEYEDIANNTNKGFYALTLIDEVKRYGDLAGKICKSENFDIIHAHDWLSFPAGMEAKSVSGKPLVVHVHSTEFDRTGGNINPQVYEIEKKGMEMADKVIAVSYYTKDIIVQKYALPSDKVVVVHNGIDVNDYQKNIAKKHLSLSKLKEAGYQIVLFVGRVTLQKGPDYFLEAAQKVLYYKPNVMFVIAGSGDMEHQIMKQTASLGISDKVIFAGFLRGDELNEVYKAADLFVLPSVSEPFGIAPLESIINGTPVLISKQAGVSEVLSHALKADFWDIDEMASKILAVLDHRCLKKSLQENSAQEVKKITWSNSARKCLSIYQKILEERNYA